MQENQGMNHQLLAKLQSPLLWMLWWLTWAQIGPPKSCLMSFQATRGY